MKIGTGTLVFSQVATRVSKSNITFVSWSDLAMNDVYKNVCSVLLLIGALGVQASIGLICDHLRQGYPIAAVRCLQ